jgi:hypothetical protein
MEASRSIVERINVFLVALELDDPPMVDGRVAPDECRQFVGRDRL